MPNRPVTDHPVSGAPPTAPVVSKTSGTVYEKALIERYIEENGTDPLSGEALTKEDLVDVKASELTWILRYTRWHVASVYAKAQAGITPLGRDSRPVDV